MIPAQDLLAICSRAAGGDAAAMEARIAAVTTFKSDVKRQAVAGADVQTYFEALMDANEFRDETLRAVSFSAICYLTRRVLILDETALEGVLPNVLPLFIDRFAGDNVPETAAKLAIRTFEDVWLGFPAETEQALREHGLSHSRPAVRQAALQLLSQHIARTPKFPFRKFTPSVTRLLNDDDEAVATAARALIVQFFSAAVPRAKEDLDREMARQKIAPETAKEIRTAIGGSARPPSRTAPAPAPTPAVAAVAKSTIDAVKQLPGYALEAIEAVDVFSVETFRKEIEELAETGFAGKESETNWRQRELSLIKFRRTLRGNMTQYPGDIVWAVKRLQDGIVKGICSLRTTLSTQACFLVKDAMQIYESYMDPAIEPFLSNLVKLSAGSKKISAAQAHVTICAMILSTSYSHKYVTQINAVMGDRVAAARALAITWLDLMFSRHKTPLAAVWQSQGVDAIAESCIERGLTDSAPAVRAASRPAYWSFAACFPDRADRIRERLDAGQKKMLLQVPQALAAPHATVAQRAVSESSVPAERPDPVADAAAEFVSDHIQPARRSVSERVSARLSESIHEQVAERDSQVENTTETGSNVVSVEPDQVEPAQIVQKGAELLKARIEEDPETKQTVEEVAKLVEATAREARAKIDKAEPKDSTEKPKDGAEPKDAEPDAEPKDTAGEDTNHAEADKSDEPKATGAIDEAVEEVKDKLDMDPEKLKNKLSSLSEMLSSEDVSTLNQGVSCLSYILRGQSVPEKLAKDLVSIDLPDPDLIGRALSLLFSRIGDEMPPEITDTVSKFVSPDLVAVSLDYIGHAAVLWAAVNLLPAETVLLVFEVIKPLMDLGTLVEAIFDVVTSDSPAETATLVCGQLLLRLDKVPMTDALRGRVQQVLSVVYRFGDLAGDVSDFIGSWLGGDSDSSDDEEKRAEKQSHKDERAALANTSGSLLVPQTPDISVYSDPVIMSHHVSVSYVPATDAVMAKPKLNLHKIASPRRRSKPAEWDLPPLPDSDAACTELFEELVAKVQSGVINKSDFIKLAALVSERQSLNSYGKLAAHLERATLAYLEDPARSENEVAAGLLLVRKMIGAGLYNTKVERTLVLQTLAAICERETSAKLHHSAVPETRDELFEVADFDVHGTILLLVDLFNSGTARRPRVFVLQSLRRLVPRATPVPEPLGEVVHAALDDSDVYIRKEAYPVLLRIHQQSESTAGLLKARMSSGQRRLFEYYAAKA